MRFKNPYNEILKKFSKKGIKYLVIGVSGINYYAKEPGTMFSTLDCDVLVKPEGKNIFLALKILEKNGYQLEANGEPIVGVDIWLARKIIEHQAVIVSKKDNALRIDLVINGGRIPYSEWEKGKKKFIVDGVKVNVGDLRHLIRAKENSDREKDRKFLQLYKIQLKEMLKTTK